MRRSLPFAILFAALAFTSSPVAAQGYNTGVGLRGGFTNGITVQHFVAQERAIEGIVGFGFRSFKLTGLYKIYKPTGWDVDGLSWYYGLGGHFGWYSFPGCSEWEWNGTSWQRKPSFSCTETAYGIGIDGVIGMEYEIGAIPFTVSFDIKPTIEYNSLGYLPLYLWDAGFSLRYVW